MNLDYKVEELYIELDAYAGWQDEYESRTKDLLKHALARSAQEERERCTQLLLQQVAKFGTETAIGQQLLEIIVHLRAGFDDPR